MTPRVRVWGNNIFYRRKNKEVLEEMFDGEKKIEKIITFL